VVNAVKYGSPDTPVRVVVTSEPANVLLQVMNEGSSIRAGDLVRIFEPLTRGEEHRTTYGDSSLGLGLFIAREIARAHGSELEARSKDAHTVFALRLPRLSRPNPTP